MNVVVGHARAGKAVCRNDAELAKRCVGLRNRTFSENLQRPGEPSIVSMINPPVSPAEQAAWLTRNAADCLPEGELANKLELGRPLRVKLGVDPTAPDITLGHTVVLRKLREFQELGHTAVLIIGDYTARVGDPSGRSTVRPVLSDSQIAANVATYRDQVVTVLNPDRLELRFNAEWLDMSMASLFALARTTTVGQLLERSDFARRYAEHAPISVLELLYPMLQGYDSVAIEADVELGGTDQTFNLLLGREIQRAYGLPEQAILTMSLLTGTNGVQKMSKSVGNYIGVAESAAEMFGKTLSIPDGSLPEWCRLLFDAAPDPALGPRDAKRALARAIVTRFHDAVAAADAEAQFDQVHVRHELPDDVPEVRFAAAAGPVHLPALLAAAFGISTSQARRSLNEGAVRIDGEPLDAGHIDVAREKTDGRVLSLGRRRFARVRILPAE
jgi:tyrosyl-tRNA synthetase